LKRNYEKIKRLPNQQMHLTANSSGVVFWVCTASNFLIHHGLLGAPLSLRQVISTLELF